MMESRTIMKQISKLSSRLDEVDSSSLRIKYDAMHDFIIWLQGFLAGSESVDDNALKIMTDSLEKKV